MNTGTAVQVIVANDDHSFSLDESALEKILLSPRTRDSKVIVLSIAGAFRKGKSFLLNFFLRYLNAQEKKSWIGDPNDSLKGFDSRAGTERCTSGILMWSNPIEVELPSGEKACVLLMDTQGAFDNQSTVKDCATVFALSTILSSVQVYNVTSNIQENDLQHLQFFAEYGRLALDGSTSKPFQDLYFLVRDFQCPYQYGYGWKGGEKYLAKCLEITDGQDEELQRLRKDLRSCFAKLRCCLMPHPGKKVSTNQHFDGRLSDIDDDFTQHVQEFVSSLLAPENLIVKEINGTKITGKELFECFKEYSKIFQGNKLPELGPMCEVTAKLNQQTAVSKAIDHYATLMTRVFGDNNTYVEPETLKRDSERYHEEAVKLFQSTSKMGGDAMTHEYLEQLKQQLNEAFNRYESDNSAFLDKAKLSHMDAVNSAMDSYKRGMKRVIGDNNAYVEPETLKRDSERYQKEAVKLFQSTSKMGGDVMNHEYLEQLKQQLNEALNRYEDDNSAFLCRAKVSHMDALKKAMETYRKHMDLVCGESKKYVDPETLKRDNERYQKQVVELFHLVDKKGGDEMTRDYLKQLRQQLNESFNHYDSRNSKKKVNTKYWKPIWLLAIFVVLSLAQILFRISGSELMANICSGGMIVVLVALFSWLYSLMTTGFPVDAAINVIQRARQI